jgi:hypothetical protein
VNFKKTEPFFISNYDKEIIQNLIKIQFLIIRLRLAVLINATEKSDEFKKIIKNELKIDLYLGYLFSTRSPRFPDYRDYLPIIEVLVHMNSEDVKQLIVRSNLDSIPTNEKDSTDNLCDKYSFFHAHGVEGGKGGLRNLANYMLEGAFRSGNTYTGFLGDSVSGRAFNNSGRHGPFFVFLHKGKQHLAYVVPTDADKKILNKVLNVAVEREILTIEEKVELQKRLFTHEEMMTLDDVMIRDRKQFDEWIKNREIVEVEEGTQSSSSNRFKSYIGL